MLDVAADGEGAPFRGGGGVKGGFGAAAPAADLDVGHCCLAEEGWGAPGRRRWGGVVLGGRVLEEAEG